MPSIGDRSVAVALLASARVARLATVRADGRPRLVPVTFALVDDAVVTAVDAVKPKRHGRLARLDDVGHDARVCLLADHYDADWSQLWWVRVDGTASLHDGDALHAAALRALREKYPQYARASLGVAIAVSLDRVTGWRAAPG